jgi:hypothetical protein
MLQARATSRKKKERRKNINDRMRYWVEIFDGGKDSFH